VSDLVDEMACQELVERVTEFLDSALPVVERTRFEEHVAECPGCEEVLGQFRAVVAVSGHLATADVAALDPSTRDQLLDLFRGMPPGSS
jgi:anti-sigma factor RsiW